MSTRTELRELREQVTRLQTVALAETHDYGSDPSGLMAAGLGSPADPWQQGVLEEVERDMLLCNSRQSGKTATIAAKGLHRILYHPGSTVLAIAPSQRQAMEILHKAVFLHRITNEIVATESLSQTRLSLANNSRFISLPASETTTRGYTPDLLILDEAAWIPDALFYALTPALAASGGQLVAMSTPGGARGWFYNEWTGGGDDYVRVKITAHECPRISEEFLRRERRRMPDAVFRSEYLCEFTDAIDSVFRFSDIIAAFTDELQPRIERLEVAA